MYFLMSGKQNAHTKKKLGFYGCIQNTPVSLNLLIFLASLQGSVHYCDTGLHSHVIFHVLWFSQHGDHFKRAEA